MEKKYNLKLNEIQASMLQRILKEEIVQQREWKEQEEKEFKKKDHHRDYLGAQMWELIEQLCAQGENEYWLPYCMNRTDGEEDELEKIKNGN